MAAPAPPNVICTPFVGRTIKGWVVKIRLCFSVTPAEAALATLWSDYAGELDNWLTLLNALSDATFVPLGIAAYVTELGFGATGVTDNAEDSASFALSTDLGTISRVSIPAPKDSIFLADNQTVDPANSAVAAFTSALVTGPGGFYASTKSGATYATFLGGLRIRRKTRRKLNIWVRNPELTAPGI